MSKSIILRFGTRNLKRAHQLAAKVKRTAIEATAEGSKARAIAESIIAANRGALDTARRERAAGLQPQANELRRANFAGQREGPGGLQAVQRGAAGAGRALAGIAAIQAARKGNALQAVAFGATLIPGPVGKAAEIALAVWELLKPAFARREKEIEDLITVRALGEVDRLLRDFDHERRMARDPGFRDGQVFLGASQRLAREEAIRSNYFSQRWVREPGALDSL